MKFSRFLLLLPVLIVAASIGSWAIKEVKKTKVSNPFIDQSFERDVPENFPLTVNCASPRRGHLRFIATALTTQQLAEFHQVPSSLEKLARAQLKFTNGYFNFQDQQGLQVIPLAGAKVKILTQKKSTYPFDVVIDPQEDNPSLYPPQFLKNSVVEKGSPALSVSYQAELPVLLCLPNGQAPTQVSITLPLDPYLSFWLVAPADRQSLTYFRLKGKTNPCSFPEMLDLKYPSMHWYVWKPDAKGSVHDCQRLLQGKVLTVEAQFHESAPTPQALEFNGIAPSEEVRFSLISGFLAKRPTAEAIQAFRESLGHLDDLLKMPRPLIQRQDPSALATLTIAHTLKDLGSIESWKIEDHGTNIVLRTRGQLKHSGRKFRMDMFIGPTVEYQEGEKHWKFLADALKHSHFIFYSGHAGMGTGFSLKQLRQHIGDFTLDQAPSYQMIAILSCFSAAYFGQDFVQERARAHRQTDILLTTSEGHHFLLTPAVIQYLDMKWARKKVGLTESLKRFLSFSSIVILQRF